MNQLAIFQNKEFGEIRTVELNKEPWFVASDICKVLDIQNATQAVYSLDEDERSMFNIGRQGEANIINESGLYAMIFKSKKPNAKSFRKWVTAEILPVIRKTGTYIKPMTEKEIMRVQLDMIDDLDVRVDKLENNMVIDYGQQQVLKKRVNGRVTYWLCGKESNAYKEISKKVFSECNKDIQDYFNVNSRNNIPKLKFDAAIDYITNWHPCTNTKILIEDTNVQMSIA